MSVKSIGKPFIYIIITFFILFLSGYYLSVCIPGIKTYIAIVGSFVAITIALHNKIIKRSSLLSLTIAIIVIATFTMITTLELSHFISYYCYVFYPIIAFILVNLVGFESFRKCFKIFLVFASFVSLLVTFLHLYSGINLNFYGEIKSVTEATYANSIFFTYNTAPYTSYRSYGLFWEPGLWASFLVIGVVFESMEEKMSIWTLLLYTVSLFFTYSAAGYLLFVLAVVAILLRKKGDTRKTVVASITILSILCLYFIFENDISNLLNSISPALYLKLYGSDSSFVFNTSRTTSFSYCWDIFIGHPFFGAGLVGSNILYEESGIALTSTSIFMMSMFGIIGIGYTLLWLYGILKQNKFSIIYRVMIAIIFVLILNKEPHHQNLFMWIVLYYFLDFSNQRVVQSKEKMDEKHIFCR